MAFRGGPSPDELEWCRVIAERLTGRHVPASRQVVPTMLSALEAVADRLDRLENPVASPTTPSRG